MGSKGGGNELRQRETIYKILSYLGMSNNNKNISLISEELFGSPTKTFHKGQIEAWQERFNQQHKTLFKTYAGDLLQTLNYIDNDDW